MASWAHHAVLAVPSVEQASYIRHIIKLHFSHHPRSRAKRLSLMLLTEFSLLLGGPHEDPLDTLLSVKLESQVNVLWTSGHLQLQDLHGNSNNVAIVLGVAASEAANRERCNALTGSRLDQQWWQLLFCQVGFLLLEHLKWCDALASHPYALNS